MTAADFVESKKVDLVVCEDGGTTAHPSVVQADIENPMSTASMTAAADYEKACVSLALESALSKLIVQKKQKEADLLSRVLVDLHNDKLAAGEAEQILAKFGDISVHQPQWWASASFKVAVAVFAIALTVTCFWLISSRAPIAAYHQNSLPVPGTNLLMDANFPHGATSWYTRSYFNGFKTVSAEGVLGDFQRGVACIESTRADDTLLVQNVKLKPHTRYKLSGWIKTEGIRVAQDGGSVGACLALWDSWDRSQSLVGTHDWTKVECIFDSEIRNACDLGPRLGHHGSIASGKAWFKDLQLVEVQPSE